LTEHFQGAPDYEALDFETGAYDVAEWYATPMDMAKALFWIQQNTEDGDPAALVRQILTVDPKLPHDAKVWPFVGFKGGSEDQLLAGNWLLKNKNGKWYTMHVYYNDPESKADPEKLIGVIGEVFKAVQAGVE